LLALIAQGMIINRQRATNIESQVARAIPEALVGVPATAKSMLVRSYVGEAARRQPIAGDPTSEDAEAWDVKSRHSNVAPEDS